MKRLLLALLLLYGMAFAAEHGGEMPVTNVHRAIVQPGQWLNTSRPLAAEDLRGRIILLDFWTFCCINCMHVIPDLHALEKEFGNKLTVIGVHSAKFANERDTSNIRSAILRYDIEHPVVNDSQFRVWKSFGVNAWPTFVLINPQGTVSEVYAGEGHREQLAHDIQKLVTKYNGRINTAPLPLGLEKSKQPETVLKFPGKLIYVPQMKALVIADSGHHRIVVVGLDGQIEQAIGTGVAGWKDGAFDAAQFNSPQGMAYKDGVLYVADTENHLLRAVDFKTRQVTTFAGTGAQGQERTPHDAPALKTPLSSPWDVAFYPDDAHLVIAMAGTHQLWSYDIKNKTLSLLAGNGHEDIHDDVAASAALAQTSGLSAYGGKLYFVDAETSSLRVLENGRVKTLIGSGLFDFGYKEGVKGTALLQHPLGVYADDSGVYVADSYNHSIRRFDVKTGVLSNFAGHGVRGDRDGAAGTAEFNEPNDITRAGGVLYVADTNNQLIRTIDVRNRKVATLDVREPEKIPVLSNELPNMQRLGKQAVAASGAYIRLSLKKGWHINPQAPSYLVLYQGTKPVAHFTRPQLQKEKILLPALEGGAEYHLQGTLYYCEAEAGSQCQIKSVDALLQPAQGGAKEVTLKLE